MDEAALKEARLWIDTVPGVVMVGEGHAADGTPTLDVWVIHPVELPDSLYGVPVRMRRTPVIEAK